MCCRSRRAVSTLRFELRFLPFPLHMPCRLSVAASLLARGGVGGLDICAPLHAQQSKPLGNAQQSTRLAVRVASVQLGQRGTGVRKPS